MRIVCQKCSAAYAIDDKFVTEKGVRAQCPRCRHLQMVKKTDAPVSEAPALGATSAASPFLFDLPTSPALPAIPAPPSTGSPFDFNLSAPPPPPAPAPLAAPTTRSPFDFDISAPPPPSAAPAPINAARTPAFPSAAPPAALPLPEFPAPPPPEPFVPPSRAAAPAPAFDFGAPPDSNPALAFDALTGAAPVGAKCKSCGKAISDPFDVALGTCDECRSKQHDRVDGPSPDTNPGRSERVDMGAISASLNGRAAAPVSVPVAPPQPTAAPPQPIFGPPPAPSTAVRTAQREGAAGGSRRAVAGLVAGVVAIVAVAGLLYWKRPWVRRTPKLTTIAGQGTPAAIDSIVQKWKRNYPELADEGAPQAMVHIQNGEQHLARDTTTGYAEAESEFEQALVLDSSSDRAIAGWALAVAFGRGGEIDELTSKTADAMLVAAEQRSGSPALYVAHAHLDIARGGNANDVQHRAEIGKNAKDPHQKALAMLAVGQAQLNKNDQTAEQHFKEALALDPKLKRAYLFQARLATSLGKYREASDALEKRLSLDPDQWEAAEMLARLSVEVGDLAKAKKVLEDARVASPKSARPRIALAIFSYQHQQDLSGAGEVFAAITVDSEVARKEQVDALLHLAIVRRLQGDLDRANDAIERAVELQPDHVPARVQQVLILTDRGVGSQARLTFDALKGRAPPALETVLEGRLLFLEGRHAEAIPLLVALADKDPAQTASLLLAGAAAAKARKDGKAWELCLKRALRMDPLATPLQAMTAYFIRPADVLRPAAGAWANLASGTDEDPNPFLCEGLVAYHAEDNATAEKNFARVTSIDPRSADGFAMRAFLALRRRDIGMAMNQGAKAVGANKTHGLARFSLGMAMLAANKLDLAKGEANEANKVAPTLLGPRVIKGDVEARQKNPDEARRLLTGVLLADPTYREAKKVLFKQSL